MNTLVNIADEKIAAWEMIKKTEGEINPEIENWLLTVDKTLESKVDNYHFIQKEIDLEAASYRADAKLFSAKAKALENLGERLKARIKYVMTMLEQDTLAGEKWIYHLTKSKPKLVIDDELSLEELGGRAPVALPEEFKMSIIKKVPDRALIEKALLSGVSVPGVRYETVNALRPLPYAGGKK